MSDSSRKVHRGGCLGCTIGGIAAAFLGGVLGYMIGLASGPGERSRGQIARPLLVIAVDPPRLGSCHGTPARQTRPQPTSCAASGSGGSAISRLPGRWGGTYYIDV
jgi:hypothetical protein